ncbi:MAG: adenylosuccinate synthase [Bacteroidia bacterium]|nr:adenylosuccinate synthase [Bacteroidia bacterium]
MVDVLLGLQWGDEGKGKIVDYLAPQYDIVARFQGGPNAGHTLKFEGKKFVLHTIPSGIFREGIMNFIGNGVVVDPITISDEIAKLISFGVDYQNRLFISKKAHLILPTHRLIDATSEAAKGKKKIGSTLKGIGPTYMDKTGRNGLRVGDLTMPNFESRYQALREKHLDLIRLYPEIEFDLAGEETKWFESIEVLKSIKQVDGVYYINNAIASGKKILAEGAQGSMLDIDFGTYPYVTSSNTIASGVCNGLGIAPTKIGEIIGIAKAYCTRVGSGPFPTELNDEVGEKLRKIGQEFGATTGRARRCGWLDLPQLKYSILINGITQLVITKADVLNTFEAINVATAYRYDGMEQVHLPYDLETIKVTPKYKSIEGWTSDLEGLLGFEMLPDKLLNYLKFIESFVDVPITMVSTGPERKKLIVKKEYLHA